MNGPTAKELGTALKITERGVRKRAAAEAWRFQEEQTQGGLVKRFEIASLPATVQKAWLEHQEAARPEVSKGEPLRREVPPSLIPYIEAQDWNRQIADDRATLLEIVFGNGRKPEKALLLYDEDPAYADLRARLGSVTLRTLYRWQKLHREGRLAALLTAYGKKGLRKLTPEMCQAAGGLVWKKWPRSVTGILRFLRFKFGYEGSYQTVRRFYQQYERLHYERLLFKFRRAEWQHKMMPSLGDASAKATHPNHFWEADTTPADILCRDGRRRKVIAFIDIFSRRAHLQLVDVEDADAVAATLRATILAFQALPEVLLMDNGMVYHKSHHMQRICGELGIQTPWLEVQAPWEKPHIERFFRTLSEQVFAELPGYTGNCLLTRPDEIRLEMEPEELQRIMDQWLRVDYHETVHSRTGQRPRERAQMPGYVAQMVDERELDILLWRQESRLVSQGRVRCDGRFYSHPELPNGEYVTLLSDPGDAGRVVVFHGGRFRCVAEDYAAKGLTPKQIKQDRKERRQALKESIRAEERLARHELVENHLLERLDAQEELVPAILPQRAEVIRLQPYAEVVEALEGPGAQAVSEDEPAYFGSDGERYKHLITKRVEGREPTASDLAFMARFEASEEFEEQRSYFESWEAFLRATEARSVNG